MGWIWIWGFLRGARVLWGWDLWGGGRGGGFGGGGRVIGFVWGWGGDEGFDGGWGLERGLLLRADRSDFSHKPKSSFLFPWDRSRLRLR